MGIFDKFQKKDEVVQPVAQEVPVTSAVEPVQMATPEVPVTPAVEPVPMVAPEVPVNNTPFQEVQTQPIVEQPVPIEPTTVAAPIEIPVEVQDDYQLNLENEEEEEEEIAPEFETGAVVETPQPIVEQQIALDVDVDDVFEGGPVSEEPEAPAIPIVPVEPVAQMEATTSIQEEINPIGNMPIIENVEPPVQSVSADLPEIQAAPLVTPEPVIESYPEPITIPEVVTETVQIAEPTPIVVEAAPSSVPVDIPMSVSAPVEVQPVQAVEAPIQVVEPTSIINEVPVTPTIEPIPMVTPEVPVAPAVTPIGNTTVHRTRFCDSCGEMITASSVTKCPNCGMDL